MHFPSWATSYPLSFTSWLLMIISKRTNQENVTKWNLNYMHWIAQHEKTPQSSVQLATVSRNWWYKRDWAKEDPPSLPSQTNLVPRPPSTRWVRYVLQPGMVARYHIAGNLPGSKHLWLLFCHFFGLARSVSANHSFPGHLVTWYLPTTLNK